MRISSGDMRGRLFEAPRGHRTHPMNERMKIAMFNSLSARYDFKDMMVLDAFAGSGALGFEAVSRGAKFAYLVEMDTKAYRTICENIEKLKISSRVKATRANVATWSKGNEDLEFDLIFADPPYDDLNLSTIEQLAKHLSNKGLMVLSHTGRETTPTVNGVVVVDNRKYGNAALSYYRKTA